MSGNYCEAEFAQGTARGDGIPPRKGSRRFVALFLQLMNAYPASGSKIDWNRVPGSIERVEEEEALQVEQFSAFFDEIVQKFRLVGDVVYVGDSATDFALTGSLECMREVRPELLAIPQHHYLIGPKTSWCMCFTMEGDMGFGFCPSPTKIH